MAAKKDFEIGDLVWAKMRRFPYWPAKIVNPPTVAPPKKSHQYVYFFGSENHAWIQDENVVHHSEKMLQSTPQKKSVTFKSAVEEITRLSESALKEAKSPGEEKESPEKPKVSTSSTEKEITKVQKPKIKTEIPKVQKKTVPKKRCFDESPNRRTTPPLKLPKKSEDYSALILNTPPNISYNRVAVIRPLEDRTISNTAAGIARRDYYELMPLPPLDLQNMSEALKRRNITPTDKKIGFIGLGMMGQRLVKCLITTGHNVTVWNRTTKKCNDFVTIGASIAQTPCDMVEKCDIIFCCVSGPEASHSLVFGNCGILKGLEKALPGSKGYVELTTLDLPTSNKFAEAIAKKGGKYLEAPISGSRLMAEEGALTIFGAGDRELFIDCKSCFLSVSKDAMYFGYKIGIGIKMKVILSMLTGTANAALGEAMALAERCDFTLKTFLEVLEIAPIYTPLYMEQAQAILQRSFITNTSLKYQQKDLNLALSLGNMYQQPLFVTSAANDMFKHAKLLRYADHDVSAVYLGAKY